MPLFGSSSRASTSNEQTTVANYNTGSGPANNVNFGDIRTGRNSTVTIDSSDYGAIAAGTDLARAALATSNSALAALERTSNSALGQFQSLAGNVLGRSLDVANRNQVSESAQGQNTLFLIALVAGAAFVASRIFK